MARGPKHRRLEERIFDIVRTARELGFRIIVGSPVTGPEDIQRIEPPLVPGEKGKLEFYIGTKAWEMFRAAYFLSDDRMQSASSILAGIEIEHYKPPAGEPGDGTA